MRTYGRLQLEDDGQWRLDKVEPHVCIRLKQIFPAISRSSAQPFFLTRSHATDADVEWFAQRYPLEMSDGDRATLLGGKEAFLERQAEMERLLMPDYKPGASVSLKEGKEIRPYQWQAIEILRRRGSLLIGDEVGLGKTISAAGFLVAEPKALPAAIICDAHMQQQWKDKLEEFTRLRIHKIKKGSPHSLPPADVYLFRYTQAAGWVDIFKTGFFQSAIYDEPQSLRNGTGTNKGQACSVLSKNAKFRCGLSATPVMNYGDEMWHIMRFIDRDILGPWEDFAREWCTPIGSGKYKIKNPKALGSYLREQYAIVRRLKSDVGQQLPKVSRIVEHIDYDQDAVEAVEDLARTLAIKATTASFVERGSAARDLDVMVRQATGVSKAKTVAAFARMTVEAGEPILLFGWHRAVYDIWLDELSDLKPAMYTGSESATQKEESKRRFLAGETDVLIMSLRSGAGVDGLQARCNTAIFGELDWSPGIHHQAIGRLDREGQQNPVTAFFLVTDDGSDPPMMDVLGIKASEAHGIVDPHLGVEAKENDTTHLRKLVERYLSKKAAVAV